MQSGIQLGSLRVLVIGVRWQFGSLTAPKGATLSNPIKAYFAWAKHKQAENNARYRQRMADINQRQAEARAAHGEPASKAAIKRA